MRASRSSFVLAALLVAQLVVSVPLNDDADGALLTAHTAAAEEVKVAEVSSQEASSFQQRVGEVQDDLQSNADRESRHLKNEPKEENSVSSIGLRQFLYPFFPQGTGRGSWKPITLGSKSEGTPARITTSSSSSFSASSISPVFFVLVISRLSLVFLSS